MWWLTLFFYIFQEGPKVAHKVFSFSLEYSIFLTTVLRQPGFFQDCAILKLSIIFLVWLICHMYVLAWFWEHKKNVLFGWVKSILNVIDAWLNLPTIWCCANEKKMWWTHVVMNSPCDEHALWWTVPVMNSPCDEQSLWWTVRVMNSLWWTVCDEQSVWWTVREPKQIHGYINVT